MRLDAYIRVSKVGGRSGESFISPDVQREQIAAAAALMGATIEREHVDLDQSGGKADRPGWQDALARVEAGESEGIIVAKLDRFARSTLDAAEALKRIDAAGGHFASAAERFDTTTPFGRFALTVMFALAELELGRHREQWNVSTERAIKRGAHTTTPFGYRRGPGKRLEVEPEQAAVVREVFRRRMLGESWSAIVDALHEAGARPATADAFTKPTLKRIVANRAYVGEAFYGRHRQADAHEALVTETEWQAVQIVRAARRARSGDGGALLAGLIRCAGCSYVMSRSTSGQAAGVTYTYSCNVRHGGGRCGEPASITQHIVEAHVEKLFLAHVGELAFSAVAESEHLDNALAELDRTRRELEAWRDDTRLREALGHEHYLAGLKARADELRAAESAVAAAREQSDAARIIGEADVWPTLTTAEKRRVLTVGIDAVFVRRGRLPVGERVEVLWRGEAPDGMPTRGRAGTPRAFERKPPHAGLPSVEDRDDGAGDLGVVADHERPSRSMRARAA